MERVVDKLKNCRKCAERRAAMRRGINKMFGMANTQHQQLELQARRKAKRPGSE